MKKYNLFILSSVLILLGACTKEEKPIGIPYSKVIGISDTWVLQQVLQTDEIKESEPLDVSSVLIGNTPATITFVDGGRTFSTNAGSSKLYFNGSGTWAFDDEDFPAQLWLTDTNGKTEITALQAPVREILDKTLEFKYTRPIGDCTVLDNGKTGAISYTYIFIRQ